jgi:hypothetical protein
VGVELTTSAKNSIQIKQIKLLYNYTCLFWVDLTDCK